MLTMDEFCTSFLIASMKQTWFGTPDNNQKTFFQTAKKSNSLQALSYRCNIARCDLKICHLGAAIASQATKCQGPATINMKNLDQTSFPYRAVKTFSVATHLFRGIILNIGKSLRWGTTNSMKLFKWDYVSFIHSVGDPFVKNLQDTVYSKP